MSDMIRRDNTPVARLKLALSSDSVKQQFQNALKENTNLFIASLIDLYANDNYLQNCEPKLVIMEALKAATLKLPINKALGFYYIIPFKDGKTGQYIPTGVIGYKGYLQLAQRTGQYKYINADIVYEGEQVIVDRLTGELIFSGSPTSEKAIGYFAYIETINGFKKPIFWNRKKVDKHAQAYSKSYNQPYGPWKKEFDAMAIKTVLRHILTRFGIMSVDMITAINIDSSDYTERPAITQQEQKAVGVEYETQQPPPRPPEKVIEHDQEPAQDSQNNAFKKDEGIDTGQQKEPVQDDFTPSETVDEYGTPSESPMEKAKWWNLRSGSLKDGTGFISYLDKNRGYFETATDEAWQVISEKFKKLYGEPLPWNRNGEYLSEEKEDIKSILETPAAKQLAEISKRYPDEYKKVVGNKVPESIQQIIAWMEQINILVVEARVNKSE